MDIYYDYRKALENPLDAECLSLDMGKPENALSAEIGRFTRMERMRLKNCGKETFLPEEIRDLPKLKEFWIKYGGGEFSAPPCLSGIREFHFEGLEGGALRDVSGLRALEGLFIDGCAPRFLLPRGAAALENLRILSLVPAKAFASVSLDEADGNFAALESLNIIGLAEGFVLDPAFCRAPKLAYLYISGCQDGAEVSLPESVKSLPVKALEVYRIKMDSLGGMAGLEFLDIGLHLCRDFRFPPGLESFPSLKKLHFGGMPSKSGTYIFSGLETLENLEELSLQGLGLETFPREILALRKLKTLFINIFPPELTALPLEKLRITGRIPFIPESITGMETLKSLDLDGALNSGKMFTSREGFEGIKPLPDFLGRLASLERLGLGCCGVMSLDVIKNLAGLKSLDLRYSAVSDLGDLARLTELEELCLEHCGRLRDLSPLEKLPKLRRLNIGGTDIEDISPLLNCQFLEELNIEGAETKIADLSPLLRHPSLKILHAENEELAEKFEERAAFIRRMGK
jgi:Leucine-rich repeat (LRR) protein